MRSGLFLLYGLSLFVLGGECSRALDLLPMDWTARADWINVTSCSKITGGPDAKGDGQADDTAALQALLLFIQNHVSGQTIYFPPGTYKITSTLKVHDINGITLLGCGCKSVLSYAGPKGGAMFLPSATHHMVYFGLTWEGNHLASAAYEHASQATYETNIRHENESFHNFTAPANYSYLDSKGNTVTSPQPPTAAILTGFPTTSGGGLTGETMVYNCSFKNCTMGIVQAWHVGNNFMWHVDGCQFEDCDFGINFFDSGCNDVDSCHFERSKTCDVMGGHSMHVRHCTSHGSGHFYASMASAPLSPDLLEDCWVDGWTDPTGAVHFDIPGPNVIFDCHFSHPPRNAAPPINLKPLTNLPPQLMMSNNHLGAQTDAEIVNTIASNVIIIPPGKLGSVLQSASQTFLQATHPADSKHIIDVAQPPYSLTTGAKDCAPELQAAIDAARKANNGTIVHIPPGIWFLGATLKVTGGNYTIEGAGFGTMLAWTGTTDDASVFVVEDPRKITIRQMRIAVPGGKNVASIRQTAKGPCSAIYDEITSNVLAMGNPGASATATHEPGIVFDHLPADAKVYLPHVDTPITVRHSGAARIFAKYLAFGMINVSGVSPQTGFLGVQVLEGGQQDGSGHNIVIDDNCNLTVGDYYSEQSGNDLRMSRGEGTRPGHVAIQGFLSASGSNSGSGQATTTIDVDNYEGRLFYGSSIFGNFNGSLPVQITQTGTNPIDIVLAPEFYVHFDPAIKAESSATVVQALNVVDTPYPGRMLPEAPSPLTDAARQKIARSLDDMRELEVMDLKFEFGIGAKTH
jgi:hypothetical protein